MKHTNILTENIFMNIGQAWQNVQFMEPRERKVFIKKVIALTRTSGSFIDYAAKYYLASLIDKSECYFNGVGYSTPVKEFMELGWYKESGKKIDGSPMYELDFNKLTKKNMEQNDKPQGPNTDETAARENISPEMKKSVVFEAPKITIANANGKQYLFAADSFLNSFPEMLHCVYSVPDLDYTGPYFEKYVSDRIAIIEGAGRENKIYDSPVFHHPHEVEMWPDTPKDK